MGEALHLKIVKLQGEIEKLQLEGVMNLTDARNKFLLKHYIMYNLCGYKYSIYKYLLEMEYEVEMGRVKGNLLYSATLTRWILGSILLIYFIGAIIFMQICVHELGTFSTLYWIVGLITTILYKALITEPLYLFWTWVVGMLIVKDEVLAYRNHLHFRGRTILRRKTGLLRNANSSVQHLNPAIRAAQNYPQLGISRLLMSLNDYDIIPVGIIGTDRIIKKHWTYDVKGSFVKFMQWLFLMAVTPIFSMSNTPRILCYNTIIIVTSVSLIYCLVMLIENFFLEFMFIIGILTT